MKRVFPALLVILTLITGCNGGGGDQGTNSSVTVSQGSRLLGIDVKPANEDGSGYDMAFEMASDLGMNEIKVSLDWDSVESPLGTFPRDAQASSLLAATDSYYPTKQQAVSLVLRPINTNDLTFPQNLSETKTNPFDQQTINAFDSFLTNLHSSLPTLDASGQIESIAIGNEINAWLGDDAAKWQQWTAFFDAAKARAKQLWGQSIKVTATIQFEALLDPAIRSQILSFASHLDEISLTYYPLNSDFTVKDPSQVVATDFQLMVDLFAGQTITLRECGLPSSTANDSSETMQAEFITEVFKAWDTHRHSIRLIDFAWLHDVSDATAAAWVDDYGMTGNPNAERFKSYLASLGLRQHDGTEKLAFSRLRDELQKRNWQ